MDIKLALFTGADIPIPECQIVLHQPSVNDIAFIGEENFFKAVQCLTLNKSMYIQDENDLDGISNFQIFMTMMMEKEAVDKKEAVQQLFLLIFPKYKVMILPRSLVFKENENSFMIDENNFEFLQEVIRKVFCTTEGPMDQQSFNPVDDKAKEIAAKLMRGRQRVAEQKNVSGGSIFSQYLSIISVGLQISLTELVKYTMYQVFDIMERYSLYINWDIDIRSRLAGAKPDSQPDNWMKNIH